MELGIATLNGQNQILSLKLIHILTITAGFVKI